MTRTAIVTGAYGAIGKAIVAGIAGAGFHVVLAGRDEQKLHRAVEELSRNYPAFSLEPFTVDLSVKEEITRFSRDWKGPIHVLVNNAATAPRRRIESAAETEMQWAVNVLSYYHMIRCFAPMMTDRGHARIVNVASYWAGGLDLSDPEFKRRRYDNDAAYRQSKQADRMLTRAFAERLAPAGITVNACHPGDVNSKLSNDLGFGGHESPAQGAATPVWLAVSGDVKNATGNYFAHRQEEPCPFMADRASVEALFNLCEGYQ